MTFHALKYHLGIPGVAFLLLVAVGVPVGSAFFMAALAGCMSMMLMMARSDSSDARRPGTRTTPDNDGAKRTNA